jgi:hydroxymethylglutaryl-CoA reductase (NADPH)
MYNELNEIKAIRKSYAISDIARKVNVLSSALHLDLKHISGLTYDSEFLRGNIENVIGTVQVPLGLAGPMSINGTHAQGDFYVPFATTEGALVLTYDLGMRLARMCGPIEARVISNIIHCDPMFVTECQSDRDRLQAFIQDRFTEIKTVAESGSNHTILKEIQSAVVADSSILVFVYFTHDAHGLNMINNATFNACAYIREATGIPFFLRSQYSGVKHHSVLNESRGYGRRVEASITITRAVLSRLGVTARQMKFIYDRCHACGSAAGVSMVNVHAANAIAGLFLATGQDIADISSSHVCDSSVELSNDGNDAICRVELPNLLVATVGGGTCLGTQRECLQILGCYGSGKADKLAEIIAATVLAGEFVTASAILNESYVQAHNKHGRYKGKEIP